jgi:uncharacterized protein GlcG (DUF336 family)
MNNIARFTAMGTVALSAIGLHLPLRAQTPSANSPTLISPAAMPGDIVLPTLDEQLHVPLGPPAGTRPTHVPAADPTPSPPLELALEAAKTAVDTCAADGYRVGVAVTDAEGHLRAGLAADGVSPDRVYTAVRKSITAAKFKMPTRTLRDVLPNNPAMMAQITPAMAVLPGAIPIMVGNRVIGAIGASGTMAYEEEKCVTVGLQKIQSRLK